MLHADSMRHRLPGLMSRDAGVEPRDALHVCHNGWASDSPRRVTTAGDPRYSADSAFIGEMDAARAAGITAATNDRQRRLDHEKRLPREGRVIAGAATGAAQRVDRIGARGEPRWRRAEHDPGNQRDAERKGEHHRRGARVDRQKGRACEGAYTDVRVSQGGPIRENLTQGDRQVAIVTAIGAEPAKHADIRLSCRRSGLLHVSPIGRLTRRLTPAPRSAKRAQLYRLSKLPGGSRCAPLRCVEGS